MVRFLALSMLFHLLVATLTYVGIPSLRKDVNRDYAIVMEVVPISELTNIKAQKVQQRKEIDGSQEEFKPVSAAAPAAAPPSESKPEPKAAEEKAEAIPDKQAPKDKTPKEPVKDEKTEQSKAKPDDKKPDKDKKENKDKKDVKEKDIFSESFLKNMEAKSAKKDKDKKNKKEFDEVAKSIQADTNKPFNDTMPMSISEIDAIRSQVQKAWNTAAFSGANNMGMQTTLYIKLDQNGNVLEVHAQKAKATSPYYQAFVDSAVRAVKIASPLKNLPKEKYATWKEIEFVFDSSGMIY